ncbi:hypothetical protein GCM10009800_02280 [Nocardiopsis rhodophaea]
MPLSPMDCHFSPIACRFRGAGGHRRGHGVGEGEVGVRDCALRDPAGDLLRIQEKRWAVQQVASAATTTDGPT